MKTKTEADFPFSEWNINMPGHFNCSGRAFEPQSHDELPTCMMRSFWAAPPEVCNKFLTRPLIPAWCWSMHFHAHWWFAFLETGVIFPLAPYRQIYHQDLFCLLSRRKFAYSEEWRPRYFSSRSVFTTPLHNTDVRMVETQPPNEVIS